VVPLVVVLTTFMTVMWLLGISPLGFFVSFGGWLSFAVLAWIAATVARVIRRHPRGHP
jgi:hypothetical protein